MNPENIKKANTASSNKKPWKVVSFEYIPSITRSRDGIKKNWWPGKVIDEKTGEYVLRGGNGSYITVTPQDAFLSVEDELGKHNSIDVSETLRECARTASRKFDESFTRKVCTPLFGQWLTEDDIVNELEKNALSLIK